jgi:hypothetical protein
MAKKKKFTGIIIVFAFLIVCLYEFIMPKFNSKKAIFSGKVISIEMFKRTGGCYITIREATSKFSFFYACAGDSDISIEDSIFKSSSADLLYVKSVNDGIVRIAKDQDFEVPRRARKAN